MANAVVVEARWVRLPFNPRWWSIVITLAQDTGYPSTNPVQHQRTKIGIDHL